MIDCPSCRKPLARSSGGGPDHWACAACGGRALRLADLARDVPGPFADRVREAAAKGGRRGVRRCPICTMHFVGMRIDHGGSLYALDFCDHCRVLWFDPGEREAALGKAPAPPPPHPVHDARSKVVSFAPPDGSDVPFEVADVGLDGGWGDFPKVLGLPRVAEAPPTWSRPWATGAAAAAIAAGSLVGFAAGIDHAAQEWGLVPAHPFRHGGLDFVTSCFLHGGFWHLFGNLWFLLMFGGHAEDVLRPGRFALLLVLSALAGKALYAVVEAGSPIPSIGASGGVSGVIVFYALSFPHARIRLAELIWIHPVWMVDYRMSARAALACWIAIQVSGAILQVQGFGDVNYLAHLGGAAVGAAFWRARRGPATAA